MSIFKTLKSEQKELGDGPDTRGYETYKINEVEAESSFEGEPFLTEIYENEFEDFNTGEMVKKYSANLYISDHAQEVKLHIRVNLKSGQDKQTGWQGSVLYDLIDSIESTHDPDFEGQNNVHSISFEELREYFNNLEFVKGSVKEHSNDSNVWNTFRIMKAVSKD